MPAHPSVDPHGAAVELAHVWGQKCRHRREFVLIWYSGTVEQRRGGRCQETGTVPGTAVTIGEGIIRARLADLALRGADLPIG
ncbi:MAG: hypothetical protein ACRDRL_21755, partial [Sciscionella sp.]